MGRAIACKAACTVRRRESGYVPSEMVNYGEAIAEFKLWIPAKAGMTGVRGENAIALRRWAADLLPHRDTVILLGVSYFIDARLTWVVLKANSVNVVLGRT